MSINRKVILVSIVLVIFILAGIICLIIYQDKNKKLDPEISPVEEVVVVENFIQQVENRNEYFNVETCLTSFYKYYKDLFNNIQQIQGEETKEQVKIESKNNDILFSMFDDKYISYIGITKENMGSKLQAVDYDIVNISNIYVNRRDKNVAAYFVYGDLINTETSKITEFSTLVTIDSKNKTFSVCLQDYVDTKYKNINLGDEINLGLLDRVTNKTYNTYKEQEITDKKYTVKLYEHYKQNILYNIEKAFSSLDSDYKEVRFKNQDEYKEYIKNNIEHISTAKLTGCSISQTEDYNQFVAIDEAGRYYIFRETAPMKYKVLLDTYSIESEESIKKYNGTTQSGKIILNIDKFAKALNSKDTRYIYNQLSEGFKNSKFKTEEDLKKYINENFKSNFYKVEYQTLKNEGDIFIYDILLSDQKQNSESIKMQIIMQLLEDRNYVMSFSIQSN